MDADFLLIRKIEKGNEQAMDQFVLKHYPKIYQYCLLRVRDHGYAEDLTQETFLSAYSSLDRFDGRNERAWLSRIATNKCLDNLKSAASRTSPAEDDELEFRAGASPGLEDEYMNAQLGRDIRAACEALREPYRSVAVEYFCEDMPLSKIAERTGEPLKTVQTRAYRAKKMLRENLKEVILQ